MDHRGVFRAVSLLPLLMVSACGAPVVENNDPGMEEENPAEQPPDIRGSQRPDGGTTITHDREDARPDTAADTGVQAADVGRDAMATEPDAGPSTLPEDGGTFTAEDGGTFTADGGGADGRPVPILFDTTVLHDVKIMVDAQYLTMLDTDRVNRVPATFTYDGTTLMRVGLRKKGSFGSYVPLSEKPAFSVDFEEFVPNQNIAGIDKVALNNCRQDPTLVAEHTGYELYRRANLPAPFTAHAVVTFNGAVKGIYVVSEATNKGFLRRNFGRANDEGNLYEAPGDVDFVASPARMELKREVDEMRRRDDMVALAAAVRNTPPANWVTVVGPLLDIPSFITGYVIDGLANHWDSYPYNGNNYYMYHRPTDGRFMMIPHGMDSLFRLDARFGYIFANNAGLLDLYGTAAPPNTSCRACGVDGELARRVRAVPALDTQYRAEVQRVLREVWDLAALNARIDQVSKLIHATKYTNSAVVRDVAAFDQNIPIARKFLADQRARYLK
jgi:spore coat protein H